MIGTDFKEKDLVFDAKIFEGENSGKLAKNIFCENWLNAKIALKSIQLVLPKKVIIVWIIDLVIIVGDKLHEKFCK
jgi:hypothetical protein